MVKTIEEFKYNVGYEKEPSQYTAGWYKRYLQAGLKLNEKGLMEYLNQLKLESERRSLIGQELVNKLSSGTLSLEEFTKSSNELNWSDLETKVIMVAESKLKFKIQ